MKHLNYLLIETLMIKNELSNVASFSAFPSLKSRFRVEWINLEDENKLTYNKITPPRSGHTSFQHNDELYLFGGYAEEEGKGKRFATNDLWKFNSETGWILVNQEQAPNVRLAAAGVVCEDEFILFGGWDPQKEGTGGVILDTIHSFDINKRKWDIIPDSIPNGPTSRHVAIAIDENRVALHNHRCLDHVLIYSHESKKFQKQTVLFQNFPSDIPSSRGLHAACALQNKNSIVLFGGAAQNGQMSNEVFLLNTKTWKWIKVQFQSSQQPCPRASPSIAVLEDDCFVMFGGAEYVEGGGLRGLDDLWILKILDYEKGIGEWSLIACNNNVKPPGRNAATLDRIYWKNLENDEAKYFMLQGGWYPFQQTFNDLFILKVTTNN